MRKYFSVPITLLKRNFIRGGFYFALFFCCLIQCAEVSIPAINTFQFQKFQKEPLNYKSKSKIAVQSFIDIRNPENTKYIGMHFLPFYPYASINNHRLEAAPDSNTDIVLEIELAKAMKSELESYSLFKNVIYTDRKFPKDAEYLIQVKIFKSGIKIKRTVFGLTTALPMVSSSSSPIVLAYFYCLYLINAIETDFTNLELEYEMELVEVKSNTTMLTKKFQKIENEVIIRHSLNKKNVSEIFFNMNQRIIEEMSKEVINYFLENKK